MIFPFKKSQITDWWLANPKNIMGFSNIIKHKALNEELVVVGLDRTDREITRSDHIVVSINEDGVRTESGSFYPIKEAHELYLQFLIDANMENTVMAVMWKTVMQLSKSEKRYLIADIIDEGMYLPDISFDFMPNNLTKALLTGYSNQLNCNVVLNTFLRRNVCIKLGIPNEVRNDIYSVSFTTLRGRKEMIKKVQQLILKRRF